jgi:hypothetical protein
MEPVSRPRFRLGPTIALAWIFAAIGMTVMLAPLMGLRGWMWLAVHHLLCAIGAGWELKEDVRRFGWIWPWRAPKGGAG